MENVTARLALFRELMESVDPNLTLVELDAGFDLIQTNAPDHELWADSFRLSISGVGDPVEMPKNWTRETKEATAPFIFTNPFSMAWMSEYESVEGRVGRIVIFGPVFLDDHAPKQIEMKLLQKGLSFSIIQPFMQTVRRMPVLSLNRLYTYGIMLHRCLTGKTIHIADFIYPELERETFAEENTYQDHTGHFRAESEIMHIVEEGNIRYDTALLSALKLSGDTGRRFGGDAEILRQAKNTVIVFATLCSRAAIRGGLSPEVSYLKCDQYIDEAERRTNLGSIRELSQRMFDDFVRQVHRVKLSAGQGASPQIIDACSYIELHIQEKLDIHMLASRAGYADYYFSNKFKKEIGKSVRDYIMERKVEKIKELLMDSSLKLGDITAMIGFETQSHMGEVFLKHTGLTPNGWRMRQKKEH